MRIALLELLLAIPILLILVVMLLWDWSRGEFRTANIHGAHTPLPRA